MSATMVSIEQLAINTIRTLSMDAVQAANSGHPGTPMALAPLAYELWANHLRYDPEHPHWPARDRFVLSCGHASMLLYSVLHLAGVRKADGSQDLAVTLDNIRNFRQLHSPCAGHPEFGEVTGAETTTGPLGQGVANSVGMAIAARWFDARMGHGNQELLDFNVYAFCSDGDLMEGVANEAASVAGHLGLANLCWVYDDNRITIEGSTDLAFSENISEKFMAMGWQTILVNDANNVVAFRKALQRFQATTDRPTLIIVRSIIGYGAPNKQNTAGAHGAPLGESEIVAAKEYYGWPKDEKFLVPNEVTEHFRETIGQRGRDAYKAWLSQWQAYQSQHLNDAAYLKLIWDKKLPSDWQTAIDGFAGGGKAAATRVWSGKVLNKVADKIPWLIGGSADLAESNKSLIESGDAGHFEKGNYGGRNFHFGIRELSMAAICNGMSLSGLRPYAATFFVFTDYLRPAMRLSALMHQPVIYLLTHDSIGLGEDGPTHQPVEHLAACRAIPNLLVMRPADGAETAEAYRVALTQTRRPTAMVLSRQNVPEFDRAICKSAKGVAQGAYVLWQSAEKCEVILIGTGSELSLCLDAAKRLAESGKSVRVVSMPCWELFDEQPESYRETVLPKSCTARVAVEAGLEMGWQKYLGWDGEFVGMKSFGASAPAEQLYQHFGITVDQIVAAANRTLGRK
jgi:transketolase